MLRREQLHSQESWNLFDVFEEKKSKQWALKDDSKTFEFTLVIYGPRKKRM